MCGIYRIAPPDQAGRVDPEALRRMGWTVRRRGPDGSGVLLAPGIGLGVQRLSIVDLEAGAQPISNEDETVSVVCNGEIYNAPELRHELEARGHRFRSRSDVEPIVPIVHLYEEEGAGCLARLRGMFAFALWDASLRRLMLVRDRLGIKPLFHALGPRHLLRILCTQLWDEIFRFGRGFAGMPTA